MKRILGRGGSVIRRSVVVAGTGGIIAGVIGRMRRTVKFRTRTGHPLATRHVMLMMKRMHLKREEKRVVKNETKIQFMMGCPLCLKRII